MQHTSFINYRANAVEAGCKDGARIRTDSQRMKYISGNEKDLSAHLSLLLMKPGWVCSSLWGRHNADWALGTQVLTAPCLLGSTEPW